MIPGLSLRQPEVDSGARSSYLKSYLPENTMPTIKHMRGAIPSPPADIAAARLFKPPVGAPPNFIVIPGELNIWGNDQYGDCVTAEEAFAKACNNPEIFIPEATVITWATQNNVLNGATLTGVLQLMQTGGFPLNGNIYNDGPYARVVYTDASNLTSAIAVGPVKIGIAADQIDTAYSSTGGKSGWFATGFHADTAEDHCVSLCGYGTISWLAAQLNVAVPAGIDGTKPGYALYTWDSIGIIDVPSMLAITQEAWLRTPTTVVKTSGDGFTGKVTLGETSPQSPALASTGTFLHLAWSGVGNKELNILCSNNGQTFGTKFTSTETSPQAPSLSVDGGNLVISWKGDGNDKLNVAHVLVNGATVTGFGNKVTLPDTSPVGTAITSSGNKLFLAWKGDGNNNLNVENSTDGGATFSGKFTSTETSTLAPALTTANGKVYIAWTGVGNSELNIAVVPS